MLDWLWQIIAVGATVAAGYFGIRSSRLQHKIDRDSTDRKAAELKQIHEATDRLAAVRNKYQSKGPIDVAKRNDFENL